MRDSGIQAPGFPVCDSQHSSRPSLTRRHSRLGNRDMDPAGHVDADTAAATHGDLQAQALGTSPIPVAPSPTTEPPPSLLAQPVSSTPRSHLDPSLDPNHSTTSAQETSTPTQTGTDQAPDRASSLTTQIRFSKNDRAHYHVSPNHQSRITQPNH